MDGQPLCDAADYKISRLHLLGTMDNSGNPTIQLTGCSPSIFGLKWSVQQLTSQITGQSSPSIPLRLPNFGLHSVFHGMMIVGFASEPFPEMEFIA
jgi:hypothetical protein